MLRLAGLTLAVSLAWLGEPPTVAAQVPQPTEIVPPVSLDVRVIRAGTERDAVDPECQALKQKLPARFRSLSLMRRKHLVLPLGQPGRVGMPGSRPLKVIPVAIIDGKVHMHVQMPGFINTRVRMVSGQNMILGPQPIAGGGHLILELRPSFTEPRRGAIQFERANSLKPQD